MAVLRVGPVVGKVTARSARVLVEVDRDGEYAVELSAGEARHVERQTVLGAVPAAYVFADLEPETRYTVRVIDVEGAVEGSFTTPSARPRRLRIGAVSCNDLRDGDDGLWRRLADDVGRLDLLLHLGDQIYADGLGGPFLRKARRRLARARGEFDRRVLLAQTREMYRKQYRETWSHPSTRAALAHVPNLMIWDDHELYDDWGTRRAERRPGTPEQWVGRVARSVYRAYQRQLWTDVDPHTEDIAPVFSGDEQHLHAWGEIGVAFFDLRSSRSFTYDRRRPYVGGQIDALERALADGPLSEVRALVVVSPVPVVFCSRRLTDQLARQPLDGFDDARDQWGHKRNQREQLRLLDLLRTWQSGGARKVLLLSGDLHFGGHTRVEHRDGTVLEQIITSPIATAPPGDVEFGFIRAALGNDDRKIGEWHFEHRGLTNARNYGVMEIDVEGPPRIEARLVE